MDPEILIVGAGISGATLAERFATVFGKQVLLLEKRNHIGGNCFDYTDQDGILVQKYGPHYFHANDIDVWNYVSRFSDWIPYEHRVLSYVDGKYVPIPVNMDTVNILFQLHIKDEFQMREWLEKNTIPIANPRNSEEAALRRVGPVLYEKMFRNYTKKQWNMDPRELDPSVMERIPVHFNRDDRYFLDAFQGIPEHGFAHLFSGLLAHPNITVELNTDYFDVRNEFGRGVLIFYTGPIDRFFEYRFGRLEHRSLRFEFSTLEQEYFQPTTVINYPNDYEFTRIHEPKHATGQKSERTTIISEYSAGDGEPYYPVLSPRNREIYRNYEREAESSVMYSSSAGSLLIDI